MVSNPNSAIKWIAGRASPSRNGPVEMSAHVAGDVNEIVAVPKKRFNFWTGDVCQLVEKFHGAGALTV